MDGLGLLSAFSQSCIEINVADGGGTIFVVVIYTCYTYVFIELWSDLYCTAFRYTYSESFFFFFVFYD